MVFYSAFSDKMHGLFFFDKMHGINLTFKKTILSIEQKDLSIVNQIQDLIGTCGCQHQLKSCS